MTCDALTGRLMVWWWRIRRIHKRQNKWKSIKNNVDEWIYWNWTYFTVVKKRLEAISASLATEECFHSSLVINVGGHFLCSMNLVWALCFSLVLSFYREIPKESIECIRHTSYVIRHIRHTSWLQRVHTFIVLVTKSVTYKIFHTYQEIK